LFCLERGGRFGQDTGILRFAQNDGVLIARMVTWPSAVSSSWSSAGLIVEDLICGRSQEVSFLPKPVAALGEKQIPPLRAARSGRNDTFKDDSFDDRFRRFFLMTPVAFDDPL
jgi:hypothetical protein